MRCAGTGDTVWTEWDPQGTRLDGVPEHTAIVTIGEVRDGQSVWMRLYMTPVQEGEGAAPTTPWGSPA